MVSAKNDMRVFRGVAVSPGICVGRACVIDHWRHNIRELPIEEHQIDSEKQRLSDAVLRTRDELESLKERLESSIGEDHIFFIDTHLMILSDHRLVIETEQLIETGLINAEGALRRYLAKCQEFFAGIQDEYLRERISDVETVIGKVLHSMVCEAPEPLVPQSGQAILIAHDLSPGDILQLDRSRLIGIVTESGAVTSHASILARAFDIPAIAGVAGAASQIENDAPLILDGTSGTLIVSPDSDTFRNYLRRKQHYEYVEQELLKDAMLPPETPDGCRLRLSGNVEIPEEAPSIVRYGGTGVGLYRTEMLFLNRTDLPGEEEQFRVYTAMQKEVAPHPLTIRTLDSGADKSLFGTMNLPAEQNPALGMRAIRLSFTMPELFKQQLRAILRTSAIGTVRIMFPMISGLEELRRARELLAESARELDFSGISYDRAIKVGVMIEIPAAVAIADLLAREADFFSVGTNDLIQYTLAIDRANGRLADMFEPLHPAVLRSLRQVAKAARDQGIDACICGEMAGNPLYLPVLLGLGYTELSMNSTAIPRVKQIVRRCTLPLATGMADACFSFSTAAEVRRFLENEAARHFSGCFD